MRARSEAGILIIVHLQADVTVAICGPLLYSPRAIGRVYSGQVYRSPRVQATPKKGLFANHVGPF
jgi:hypothetical protein